MIPRQYACCMFKFSTYISWKDESRPSSHFHDNKGELSGCHRLVQLLVFFFTSWFHLYFLLSYQFFSHGFILPTYLKEKKKQKKNGSGCRPKQCCAAASPNSVRQRVLGCMSVCTERIRPQRLPSPVLLRWPFPLMGGSSQSRAKWCVRVCVLNREAEGESEHLSIISSAPTAKWRPKVRLFSCHPVMIHEVHLPECAPSCFGLRAKCLMWMQFVCVCVCVCVCLRSEYVSVWRQMWLIFFSQQS